jgi:hypothetical protein
MNADSKPGPGSMHNQYFTKVDGMPENRGAGAEGNAPLFSGLSSSFRDLLITALPQNSQWIVTPSNAQPM